MTFRNSHHKVVSASGGVSSISDWQFDHGRNFCLLLIGRAELGRPTANIVQTSVKGCVNIESFMQSDRVPSQGRAAVPVTGIAHPLNCNISQACKVAKIAKASASSEIGHLHFFRKTRAQVLHSC